MPQSFASNPAETSKPETLLTQATVDVSTAYDVIRLVTRTMLESRSTQPALEAVVNLISEKMQVEVCSIYLRDFESGNLKLRASCGLNRDSLEEISLSPEEGLVGFVFSRGEVINIAEPRKDARFKFFPGSGEDRLNNFLGIPIPPGQPNGRGALILQSTEAHAFASVVEDLAYTLAAQLGTLLESREQLPGRVPTTTLPKGSMGMGPGPTPTAASAGFSNAPVDKAQSELPTFVRAQVAIGGIAEGRVSVLRTHQVWDSIFFTECLDSNEELKSFQKALELAKEESRWLRQRAGELFAELDARIFDAHELMLGDDHFIGLIESHIRERKSAPFSVKIATRELARAFQDSGNTILMSKAADLRDVGLRLLNALGEVRDHREIESDSEDGVIVAAIELLPSDLIYLQSKRILGILCETGGVTSHAAILARSLGIPCFMGIPGLTANLQNGTQVILDGNSGLIYIRPEAHVRREYRRLLESFTNRKSEALSPEAHTLDQAEVRLSANVSLLSDLELMQRYGIHDVGLYRSEFFFMIRNQFPDEDTQYQVYRRVLERHGDKKVTFRLLDVGGDKPLRYFDWGKEENPSLGWRSIRMLLSRLDILKPHLRALLRTVQHGEGGRLVVPMVSQLSELRAIQEHLAECHLEIEKEEGIQLRRPAVGVMIEVPSAILQIKALVSESDFICIGTNDLIQYLFAIDRGNERVAEYYQPYHPIVIEALSQIAVAASDAGKPVTVCGEMAADPLCLPILLGLGLNHLSISPASADSLRKAVRQVRLADCQKLLPKLLKMATANEVKEELQRIMAPVLRPS